MTNPYQLSPEEHEIYYREIEAKYLPKSQPQENPVAIITGGQPGAGKSGLTDQAKAELSAQGGYALIDADKFRPYSPKHRQALEDDDRQAANFTHADAGRWAGRFAQVAAASRRNLIIDQTSKDPAATADLAQQLKAAGYKVELRVMAVNERISELRIHSRYESQKAILGYGRFSTKDNHAAAYKGVAATVEALEKGRAVDSIAVYDKNHKQLYSSAQVDAKGTAIEAMRRERERPLSLQERGELLEGYNELAALIAKPERQARSEEVKEIQGLRESARFAHAAEVFRQLPAQEGVKQYPELAGAYATAEAIRRKAEADQLADSQLVAVMRRARGNIAESIEAGRVPRMELKQTHERGRGDDLER